MNKIILIGNMAKDPELSVTPSGISVCRMSIAVNRRFSKENEADFFNIIAWKALGESCHKYLQKGKKAAISGSLQTRSYDDTSGNKRYVTEIIADEVEFLSPVEQQNDLIPVEDDDLPF